jgi:hypothetical protein
MQSSDWLTIALWGLGALGTVVATLMGVLAYFLKRLIDQLDSTRRQVFSLRDELRSMHGKFKLFKIEVRLLLTKAGVNTREIEELVKLADDDEIAGPLDDVELLPP